MAKEPPDRLVEAALTAIYRIAFDPSVSTRTTRDRLEEILALAESELEGLTLATIIARHRRRDAMIYTVEIRCQACGALVVSSRVHAEDLTADEIIAHEAEHAAQSAGP